MKYHTFALPNTNYYFNTMRKKTLLVALLFASIGCFAQPKAGALQKVLESERGFMCPVWSPDSRKIAVTGDNFKGIWVAEIDGSRLIQLCKDDGAGYKMAWNEDGSQILARTNVYKENRIFHELKAFDTHTLKAETLMPATRGLSVATWRSTEKIALNKESKGFSLSRKGNLEKTALSIFEKMVADPFNAIQQIASLKHLQKPIINPALSPDKTKVAFQIVGEGIYSCDIDGSNAKFLGKGAYPTWTPDNKYVIAAKISDNGEIFTASTLLAINVETAAQTVFFNDSKMIPMTPAVSPDGKRVAFENTVDGSIYTIEIIY